VIDGPDSEITPGLAEQLRHAAALVPDYPAARFSGRGIVICAGGVRLFTCAWLSIAILRRHLGCTLPIEVWHIGPSELGPPMRSLLEALDVVVVDALDVALRHPVASLGGWQLKTFALLHSRFQEILLLDADNLPVSDPAFLFQSEPYQQFGALFWPDVIRLRAANHIWAVSGLAPDIGPSFESGQLVIDKARHWRSLMLTDWINQHHRQFEDMIYGDKDAFYVGWRMVGQGYYLIPHRPKRLDHTLCQRAPDGKTLFQHRSGSKWMLFGANPRIEGFRLEEQCFELLAELRLLWDGTIFNPPDRSTAAQAMERALIVAADFQLVWEGLDERQITLLPEHRIAPGAHDTERYWFVADSVDGLELRITGKGVLTCALRQVADGAWRGVAGAMCVTLNPATPAYAVDLDAQAVGDAAWLEVVDAVLASARYLASAAPESADVIATLSVLAGVRPAVTMHLRECARAGHQIAAAAVLRHAAVFGDMPPIRPALGSGTLRPSGNLDLQSEAIRAR